MTAARNAESVELDLYFALAPLCISNSISTSDPDVAARIKASSKPACEGDILSAILRAGRYGFGVSGIVCRCPKKWAISINAWSSISIGWPPKRIDMTALFPS